MNGISAQDAARLGVCSIPEGRGIFPNLTVRENLWAATGTGAKLEDLEEKAYARFPASGSAATSSRHGSMSGGEQQMLALSRALGTDPAVLLLDELSMGLAPMIVSRMYETVAELVEGGLSVLVAEQFARAVLPIADTAALMLHGRVVAGHRPPRSKTGCPATTWEVDPIMLTEERRQQFKDDVANQKLKTDQSRFDGVLRIVGIVAMVAGVVGVFIAYNVSLAKDDMRDVGSLQTLAVGFLAVTVLGAALYLAAAVTRVLRLWLLRQLVEQQAQSDQLAEALKSR